jgi:Fur family ferric uptake transcriptional regulator
MEKQQRMTVQKKLILETLKGLKTHPTADELYSLLKQKLPKISLGTVYRNLEQLSEKGIIKKLDSIDSQKRFDGDISPHYHIKCIKCGKVGDIHVSPIPLPKEIIQHTDYKILNHDLELTGICGNCQKK